MVTLLKFQESILPYFFCLLACLKLSSDQKIAFLKFSNFFSIIKIKLKVPKHPLLIVFVIFEPIWNNFYFAWI
jgi:hypothetical protein